jgi:hypothetical protein
MAVDWIARRGRELPDMEWLARTDEATIALIKVLADLDPAIAAQIVEGVYRHGGNLGMMWPVPHGVWPVTSHSDCDLGEMAYSLVLVDSKSSWGGQLIGQDHEYDRLRIRTDFVRQHWPEESAAISPPEHQSGRADKAVHHAYSEAALEAFCKRIVSTLPVALEQLTTEEFVGLCKSRFPHAPRASLRECTQKARPEGWLRRPGPRGPRCIIRKMRLEEFRQKILAAE